MSNKNDYSVKLHKIFYDKSSTKNCHRFVCIMKTSNGRFKRPVVFTDFENIPEIFRKAMNNESS